MKKGKVNPPRTDDGDELIDRFIEALAEFAADYDFKRLVKEHEGNGWNSGGKRKLEDK